MKIEESFTVEDVAKALKVTKKTIYQWVKEKKINNHKVGASIRFYSEDIQKFVRGVK